MKLVAIYSVWCGVELLKKSMTCLKNDVDLFIIVWQDVSNWGEAYNPCPDMDLEGFNYILVKFKPQFIGGQINEIEKRNLGIQFARQQGATHIILMDTDEMYEDFGKAKQLYIDSGFNGSVCKIYTYFKEPTLRFENPDGYYVPFIHKINENTVTGVREYPFYCDKTRQINEQNVVELPVFMNHFSYVRKDIERKCRNSSAKNNILRSDLLKDYYSDSTKEGYFVKDFGQKLIKVKNIFDINL